MNNCECLETCPFFKGEMNDYPESAELLKQRYCKGNNCDCARYLIFSSIGKKYVPKDMYPYERKRSKEIINAHK
jgi:hypothetical protein